MLVMSTFVDVCSFLHCIIELRIQLWTINYTSSQRSSSNVFFKSSCVWGFSLKRNINSFSSVPMTSSDDGVQISSTCCAHKWVILKQYLCFDMQAIQSRGQIWQRSAIFVFMMPYFVFMWKAALQKIHAAVIDVLLQQSLVSCSFHMFSVVLMSLCSSYGERMRTEPSRTQQCAKNIQNI